MRVWGMRDGITFSVSAAERQRLRDIAADPKSPQKHVWRARIVLLSADGLAPRRIMAGTSKSKTCVWRWQERFMHEGVDGLLRDRSRPPGKAPVPPDHVAEIVRLTLEPPPHEATHWTLRAMAKIACVAASTVQAIWKAHGLSPHRWRSFKLSNDPAFAEKLTEIVGKSVPEQGPVRRFGFVVGHDEKPKRRLHELLASQGIAMNQEVTFMSDGAGNLRDLQCYMRPNAEHVLDYFHISMRITVLQQMVRGLTPPLSAAIPSAVEVLDSVRRHLWHGNVGRALAMVEDFGDGFDVVRDPPPEVRKLQRYLDEFSRYIDNNAALIPNYAERHRCGEVVSTAFVESTVNQVIAKRFAKKQQMQWTPRGVHLLIQLRTRVLDGTLADDFKRWRYESRKPKSEAKVAA